ncbi:hypothetical protein T484DRAFT_3536802 [Baffinella frigidus]|nr:hypothetical protein T484DRAFT_3536802 [Cryptophyta sp. CCMP2293]
MLWHISRGARRSGLLASSGVDPASKMRRPWIPRVRFIEVTIPLRRGCWPSSAVRNLAASSGYLNRRHVVYRGTSLIRPPPL